MRIQQISEINTSKEIVKSNSNTGQKVQYEVLQVDPDLLKDSYKPQEIEKNNTYSKPDKASIARIMEESNKAHNNLKELVKQMLEKQGLTFKDLGSFYGDIPIDEETREKARKAIEGYMSPESVSDNIVNFAKAISGGDKSKLDTLKNSIEKGFEEATKSWGRDLPEISRETYDLVMSKLESWGNE